jgi:hypothetical protein
VTDPPPAVEGIDSLRHLAALARLPLPTERAADLLARLTILRGLGQLLEGVELGEERPSATFDPRWS